MCSVVFLLVWATFVKATSGENTLANTAQARKRVRQAEKHRIHNASRRSMMRTFLKKTLVAIAAGDQEAAKELYIKTTSVLDKAAKTGLIHKNKAARHKSRLNQKIKAMATAAA